MEYKNEAIWKWRIKKEFYKIFWNEIKELSLKSVQYVNINLELSISQGQASIKLLDKKYRNKRHIKNWRLISLLNVNAKILSITQKSNTPVNHFVSRSSIRKKTEMDKESRLFSDILEIFSKHKINGYFLTIDIEKV